MKQLRANTHTHAQLVLGACAKVTMVVTAWTKTRCHSTGGGVMDAAMRFRYVGGLALSRARSTLAICTAPVCGCYLCGEITSHV